MVDFPVVVLENPRTAVAGEEEEEEGGEVAVVVVAGQENLYLWHPAEAAMVCLL